MKKLLIYLILFSIAVLYSKESPFEFERFSVNLKGIAYNPSSLIVYGEACILLRSGDRGISWKQYHVDKSELNINKIINKEHEYFGILSQDYLIRSNNDGLSWSTLKIEDNIQFIDMILNKDFLFILSNSSILIYDYSLKKVNSINFNTTTKATGIFQLDNHLFVASDSGKLVDFDIENGYKQRLIDFNDLSLCNGCSSPSGFRLENGNIYLTLGSDLILSNDKGFTWTKIDNGINCFTIKDSICYFLASNFDYQKNISKPIFYKSRSGNKEIFNNDSITRYVFTMYYNKIDFINDDTLIAVGNDKLIVMSYDGGKTWDYRSNINVTATGSYWLSSESGYVFYQKGQVFKTTDGGATFLPQLWDPNLYLPFRYFNAMYFNQYGEGIVFYENNKTNGNNFLLTKDFGITYKGISVGSLIGTSSELEPSFVKQDSHFVFVYPAYGGRNHQTQIFLFDEDLNKKNWTKLDSLSIILIKLNKDGNELEAIGYERKYPNQNDTYDIVRFYLMSSSDYGSTWSKIFSFTFDYELSQVSEIDGKYYFTTTRWDSNYSTSNFLNIFDPLNKNITKNIYIGYNVFGTKFFKFGDKLLISGWDRIFSNINYKTEPYIWSVDSLKNYYLSGTWFYFDNQAYVAGVDYFHNQRSLKFYLNKTTEVKETEILKTYVYSEPPYPIPASNKIHCKIYWDSRYDINDAKLSVYDIFGHLISSYGNISIIQKGTLSGEIIWDCSQIPDGIYYISFVHGDARKIIPVVINR